MPRYELIIPPALDGRTVRQAAMGGLRLSGGQFKRAKFHGALMANGSPVLADRRVRAGDHLLIDVPEAVAPPPEPFQIPLRVPYEDAHFWMIDKPAPLPARIKKRAPRWRMPSMPMRAAPKALCTGPSTGWTRGPAG